MTFGPHTHHYVCLLPRRGLPQEPIWTFRLLSSSSEHRTLEETLVAPFASGETGESPELKAVPVYILIWGACGGRNESFHPGLRLLAND